MRFIRASFLLIGLFLFTQLAMAADAISVTKQTKIKVDKETHSTINLSYPLINHVPQGDNMNAAIQTTLTDIVSTYKKNLAQNQPIKPIDGLPLTNDSNTLEVTYKIYANTANLLSIRFSIYTNFYGSAHPLNLYQSWNYGMKQNRLLSLNDVFASSDYLTFLSTYSQKALTEKLTKMASQVTYPDAQGIKATPDNFKTWNLTNDGLIITFQPYQVAPYVFGAVDEVVPMNAIKNKLKPDYQ